MSSNIIMQSVCLYAYSVIISTTAAWDYIDPSTWSTTYAECGGSTQSPIDIPSHSQSLCPSTQLDSYLKWLWKTPNPTYKVENNGHTVKITPMSYIDGEFIENNKKDNTMAILTNNFVDNYNEHQEYCLDSIHFHFGEDEHLGSEHTIDGKRYPLEAHFVHFSCDYDDLHKAITAATSPPIWDPYTVAVVAVLFEIDNTNPNPFIELISSNWVYQTNIFRPFEPMELTINSSPLELIPTRYDSFYYYKGSFTTPPCSEIVRWHVLEQTMTVSNQQLSGFREMWDHSGNVIGKNWRPIQANTNSVHHCG